MTVEDIVKLIENSNTPDFGPKNWQYQPSYFQKVLENVDVLKYRDSLFIELGVFTGLTLNLINKNTEDVIVYGFDTFTGLPEDWAESSENVLYTKNSFSVHGIPEDTEKNKFIVGRIEDTLSNFLKEKNQKIRFIHLDLDLYSTSKNAFEIVFDWLEDEAIVVVDDVYALPSWEEYSIKALADCFDESKYELEPVATCGWKDGWASMALKIKRKVIKAHNKTTIVTGLWDLGRGNIKGWAKRSFEQYKNKFFELLEVDAQMCIWIPRELEQEVRTIRGNKPTQIYFKELEDFKTWFPFFNELQEIRNNPNWYNNAGWLPESPQAALEYYNPMMMCKMFMVNDSAIMNPFGSDYFYWIDGGLTSTVGQGYFTSDKVFDKLEAHSNSTNKLTFITYPYESNTEIHGFERSKMAEYCGVDFVSSISRGGFWGGKKEQIHQLNALYYSVLQDTISGEYMGADECLFTILTHRHPELIEPFGIGENGLVWPFFEYLKSVDPNVKPKNSSNSKASLYVISYNSPKQFGNLIESFQLIDPDFLQKTRKILLNNSLDHTTDEDYNNLCKEYNFEQVKKDNIGICGGRQWVAEHFNDSDSDYYIFFEDDMFLHPNTNATCRMGLRRHVDNLFRKSLSILKHSKFDYLKLSFSEFYGESSVQWAWYNVPQDIRSKFFSNNDRLPQRGLSPNAPKTEFKHIGCYEDLPFVEGDLHYCNWPLWFSKEGNKKVFLDTTWSRPMEQTWMSFVFQLQKENKIKAGSLLISPINHNRFEFYPGEERREN